MECEFGQFIKLFATFFVSPKSDKKFSSYPRRENLVWHDFLRQKTVFVEFVFRFPVFIYLSYILSTTYFSLILSEKIDNNAKKVLNQQQIDIEIQDK